jgi:hypothetical protein
MNELKSSMAWKFRFIATLIDSAYRRGKPLQIQCRCYKPVPQEKYGAMQFGERRAAA